MDSGEIEMIQTPMDVLERFPVRKTKAQKTAFLDAATAYAQKLGYYVSIEGGNRGVRNIVIGDPDAAKYLVTAHYDTPASIGLPNFITPNNPITYFGIQLALVAVLLAVAVLAGFVAFWLGADERIAFLAGYIVYFAILVLMLKGPANRNNANDNTSGVVTVLELLSAIAEDQRKLVCFVLFDLEEAGLVGSGRHRKLHKAATENQIVLNLDCVGDGDVIQFTPVKKAAKDRKLLESLSKICKNNGQKELRLRSKGFYGGNSDHKKFPMGVAIMAFRYQKGIGLYCGRIHTWRDTILDYENIVTLRDALLMLIADHSKNIDNL